MAYTHYERLSALDSAILEVEDASVHMHMGSVAIFEAAPLMRDGQGLDIDRILAFSDAALQKNPRFRQRIAYIPRLHHPVWVDDEKFNLAYHVRHVALPAPGDDRRLKRLAGRLMSQQLDRGKPLWEMWFVEGVQGGRFAVISKVHHAMADGIAGADLFSALMGPDPDHVPEPRGRWIPRPAPSGGRLILDEVSRRATASLSLLRPGCGLGHLSVRDAVAGVRQAVSAGFAAGGTQTPLNTAIGPHRRFDWARFDENAVREVGELLGATADEVVLATVAGAVRAFLRGRGIRVEALDFEALVPVSLRGEEERGPVGRRISSLLARLPLDEADPRVRLQRVIESVTELEESRPIVGGPAITGVADTLVPALVMQLARIAARGSGANLVVTNLRGPRQTVYLLGAPLREVYPVVPLAPTHALAIALFSYAGTLFWGFNSDWDELPDLHDFVSAIESEFQALQEAAGNESVAAG
jgi:diacylglycerol O-acyltransferase